MENRNADFWGTALSVKNRYVHYNCNTEIKFEDWSHVILRAKSDHVNTKAMENLEMYPIVWLDSKTVYNGLFTSQNKLVGASPNLFVGKKKCLW